MVAGRFAGLGLRSICAAAALGGMVMLAGCGAGVGANGTNPAQPVQVSISGASSVRIGSTTQFTATVTNTNNRTVTWQINGVAGGSSTTGTINTSGLYTPPTTVPTTNTVTVTAVSQAQSSASGSEAESILNPLPVLTSATANSSGGTSYVVTVAGSGFVSGSVIQASGVNAATNFISTMQLTATVTIAAGTTSVAVDVVNPNPGGSTSGSMNVVISSTSQAAAARMLDQTSFGATAATIAHVQSIGQSAYLTEQFTEPTTILPDIANPVPSYCGTVAYPCVESTWWKVALTGNDQLRQRVAFALSEIFVVSSASINGYAITPYHNMLANDAFGNFATIMNDVSLSTAMGGYLNMLNSAKPATGQIANENYPRELMQLFTLGLYELNQDGSLKLDGNGNTIAPYTETDVQNFAKAYTGWTYANADGSTPTRLIGTANYDHPMVAVESEHDMTQKTVLGTTLPSGQSAEQDLAAALAVIFNQPNAGPFVCKQLIQHLVTSNPSAAYVARVSAVFANDGNNVRGDMKAVITAILTDTEARAGDTNPSFNGGHMREPILWMTATMRGLGYTNTDTNGYYGSLSNYAQNLNERPYRSGSVFNFFPPSYVIPGTTVNAPEFGLENTASAILRLTQANSFVYNKVTGFTVDLSATSTLGVMASNPGALVDQLGLIFMDGQMPATMRTDIVNHITTLTDPAERVRVATYLVITSSFYKIEH
jgi:uncharacterized protein (DUF1800 family)